MEQRELDTFYCPDLSCVSKLRLDRTAATIVFYATGSLSTSQASLTERRIPVMCILHIKQLLVALMQP